MAEGSPRQLIERYATREVLELRFDAGRARRPSPSRLDGLAERIEMLPDRLLLYTDDGDALGRRRRTTGACGPSSVLVRRSTLEDVFLRLTGRTLVD